MSDLEKVVAATLAAHYPVDSMSSLSCVCKCGQLFHSQHLASELVKAVQQSEAAIRLNELYSRGHDSDCYLDRDVPVDRCSCGYAERVTQLKALMLIAHSSQSEPPKDALSEAGKLIIGWSNSPKSAAPPSETPLREQLHKILDDLAADQRIKISAYWYQEINVALSMLASREAAAVAAAQYSEALTWWEHRSSGTEWERDRLRELGRRAAAPSTTTQRENK
jgi:hypothetical protein